MGNFFAEKAHAGPGLKVLRKEDEEGERVPRGCETCRQLGLSDKPSVHYEWEKCLI